MEHRQPRAPQLAGNYPQEHYAPDQQGDRYQYRWASGIWQHYTEDDVQYMTEGEGETTSEDELARPTPAGQDGLLGSPSHQSRAALGLNEYTLTRLWYKVGKEVESHIKKTGQQPTDNQVRAWAIECDVLGARRDILLAAPSDETTHVHDALSWIIHEGLADLFEGNRVQLPSTPVLPRSPAEGFLGLGQQESVAQPRRTDRPPVKESFDRLTARTLLGMQERALYNDFRDYCFHIASVRGLSGRTKGWLAWQIDDFKGEILKLAIPEHVRAVLNPGRHSGNDRLWQAFEFLWKTVMWDYSARQQKHRKMPGVGKREHFLVQYPQPKDGDSDSSSIPDARGTRRSNRIRKIYTETSVSTDSGEADYQPDENGSSMEVQSAITEAETEGTPVTASAHVQAPPAERMNRRSEPATMRRKRKSITPPTETRRRRERPANGFVSPSSPTRTTLPASANTFHNEAATATRSTAAHPMHPTRAPRCAPRQAHRRIRRSSQAREARRDLGDEEHYAMASDSNYPLSASESMIASATSSFGNSATTSTRASIFMPTMNDGSRPIAVPRAQPIDHIARPPEKGKARQVRRAKQEDNHARSEERDYYMGIAALRSLHSNKRNMCDSSLPRDPAPYCFPEHLQKENSASGTHDHEVTDSIPKASQQSCAVVPGPAAIEAAVNWAMLDKSAAAMWSVLELEQQEELRRDLRKAYVERMGKLRSGESMHIVHGLLAGMVRERIELVSRASKINECRRFC